MKKNTYWVVDNEGDDRQEIEKLVRSVDASAEFKEYLESYDDVASACKGADVEDPTAIILDYMLGSAADPGYANGIRALQEITARFPTVPVFMLTGKSDAEHVLNRLNILLKYNLLDNYFEKEEKEKQRLKVRLSYLLMVRNSDSKILDWTEYLGEEPNRLVGKAGWMYRDLSRKAILDIPVLVQGPSGSGKELIARMIHEQSFRDPIVPVNCSAIPDTLFESEFFGYVEGAFTDAKVTKKGYFLQADGGTLFLDEVADLTPLAQAKLLRALEYGFFMVGGDEIKKPDVRIISATRKNLQEMVRNGEFRNDLYYRLCGVRYLTHGVKDPQFSPETHEENLEVFMKRCLAEHYESRKAYYADHYDRISDELSHIKDSSLDKVARLAAEIALKRLDDLKTLFDGDGDLLITAEKEELLDKASSWLGIPHKIPNETWRKFVDYSWPGNYREIRHVIRTVVSEGGWEYARLDALDDVEEDSIQSHLKEVAERYLPDQPSGEYAGDALGVDNLKDQLEDMLVRRAFQVCHGERQCIANMLKKSPDWVSKNEVYKGLRGLVDNEREDVLP